MIRSGTELRFGEIVIAKVPYVDFSDSKTRPALVLFQESDNVVVLGITSNPYRKGIIIGKEEGIDYNSVIRVDYIFTLSQYSITKKVNILSQNKKEETYNELIKRINS